MPRFKSHHRPRVRRARRSRSKAYQTETVRKYRWNRLGRRGLIAAILLSGLAVTTALLSVLSPRPLAPDVSGSLFISGEAARSLDFEAAFRTRVPIRHGYWTGIVVRASGTRAGDAATLSEQARHRGIAGPPDHFIIGNGNGMEDGEIQFTARWSDQLPAALSDGGGLISICLIADVARQPPSQAQMARLGELVSALRQRLNLPTEQNFWPLVDQP